MRILLASNSPYYPSAGGGNKSNRLLMEELAKRGHQVRVVTRTSDFRQENHLELLAALAGLEVEATVAEGEVRTQVGGVEIRILTTHPDIRRFVTAQIQSFRPDIVLTSTDDPAHLMIESALRSGVRIVYLIRATVALPFGPDSSLRSDARTAELRQLDGFVGVSHYVAEYARLWGGMDAVHVPISLLEARPLQRLGCFDNRYVTMINPCTVKGISIFLALADRLPGTEFAAVPTWGTTKDDLDALQQRSNVTLLPTVEDIDEILAQTRVMLVPSLWAEARSRMILESMSRGIPVLASSVGGLAEAMLGVDYLLPVTPVTRFEPAVDGLMVPRADAPQQDIEPWVATLSRLVSDRCHWDQLASRSFETATAYASGLSVAPFEEYLEYIARKLKSSSPIEARPVTEAGRAAALSPEKQRLLAARIQQTLAVRGAQSTKERSWLPAALHDRIGDPAARRELAEFATQAARKELGPDTEVLWNSTWVFRSGSHYFPTPRLFEAGHPVWRKLAGTAAKYIKDAADYWFHVYRPKPGDIIADIGAGQGEDVYAFAQAVGPTGRVIAIEPHPDSYAILQSFCELNRLTNVTTVHAACVDRPQTLQIETLPVWESNFVRPGARSGNSFPVRGLPFDEICRELGIAHLDFLKMNIEGAEVAALPGCRTALERTRNVCVAAHDFRADRGEGAHFRTLAFVRDFLSGAGFALVTRDHDPRYYVPYHVHGFRAI